MAPTDPATDDLIDNRYRLIEPMARGGSATVWRGCDERLSRVVAIKILAAAGRDTREEAKALARLAHPHIAGVFDYGVHRGRAYLVLELVEGRSLACLQGIPPAAGIAISAQIAEALAAAHARRVVHRDVTPANIMLTSGGVKLIDFGISAVSGGSEVDEDGALRGTPAYAAPERRHNATVEPPSDMYSFGVVLHILLNGTRPDAATPAHDLPPMVAQLYRRCLATDPAERPSAMAAAQILADAATPHALDRFLPTTVDEPVTAFVAAPSQPRRKHAGRIAAVAGLGALIWLAAWSTVGGSTGDPPSPPAALAAPPPAAAEPSACVATYEVLGDGALTVAARDSLPQGWQVTLQRPSGRQTSSPQRPLAVGQTVRVPLPGRSDNANPLPTTATVGDRRCDLILLAAARTPKAAPVTVGQPAPAPKAKPDPPRGSALSNGKKKGRLR